MRGYFGIGVERISKAMNLGNLFPVDAAYERRRGSWADTSDAPKHVPFYEFPDAASMILPEGCALVGVELLDDAVELPSFRHPRQAAYVFGPERGALSPEMVARCDHVIKIPTRFCINVGMAGVVVMYDRLISLGRFARRPELPGGPPEPLPDHVHGGRMLRRLEDYRAQPPEFDYSLSTPGVNR